MPLPTARARLDNAAMSRPVMVYDGRCSFCRRWVGRWRSRTGEAIEYVPYQDAATRFPKIPLSAFEHAVHFIEPGANVSVGAKAVFRSMHRFGDWHWPMWMYDHVPGFAPVTEAVYRFVAAHRNGVDAIDMRLIGKQKELPSYVLTREIFLRCLGAVFFIAFLTLLLQIDGLIGSRGILPIGEFLDRIRAVPGHGPIERASIFPTLCWISSSDGFLHFMCTAGIVLSWLLMAGWISAPVLAALWVLHLSLSVAGQEFLGFQWDALLNEAGFLAIFLAPLQWLPRRKTVPPPRALIRWLIWWLLFRLLFMSGVVKLSSGDVSWAARTAMNAHYQTQPLPPWPAWFMHHLPGSFQSFSVLVVFAAELIIPLFIFTPRRPRMIAFWGVVVFQMLLIVTGNYGFFNVLTIVLCLPLLDDSSWPKWMRARRGPVDVPSRSAKVRWPMWIIAPVGMVIFLLTLVPFTLSFRAPRERAFVSPALHGFEMLYTHVNQFQIANTYGLFQVMTLTRHEIVIEGSNDSAHWKEYEFRYKPGNVMHRPALITPLMPRLDWQMWFEALSEDEPDLWFRRLLLRLLQGSPPVRGLFAVDPFGDHPPKYVRATLYDYRFTTSAERAESGAWWHRERIGEFFPAVSLRAQGGDTP